MRDREPKSEHVVVRDPELEYQGGVIAADAITIRLAARKFEKAFPTPKLNLSEIVEKTKGDLFAGLADISVEGMKVTASIDTGKMEWDRKDAVKKDTFTPYQGEAKQSTVFIEGGLVIEVDGAQVSRQVMKTPAGEIVYAWFAQLPEDQTENIGRYTLIAKAESLAKSYDEKAVSQKGTIYKKISVPAVNAKYEAELPEIVEANKDVESGKQIVVLALDHTGARAGAKTILVMRGASLNDTFMFGSQGPVAYWFTEKEDRTPFAVTVTKPESWIAPGDEVDFDFDW